MLTSNKPKLATIVEERITKVNGDFHIKKYLQGDLLGKGGFAKVYKFTNLETNKIMAGKIMPKANFNRSRSRMKVAFSRFFYDRIFSNMANGRINFFSCFQKSSFIKLYITPTL